MNDRRTFLFSKEEVKNLGIELTENTTDDIAVLYLPIKGISGVSSSNPIKFKYRTKDHVDLTASTTVRAGESYSYLGANIDLRPIALYAGFL